MNLSEKQKIFSQNVAKLINYIYTTNYSCSIGEVYRTPEQAKIYADQGRGILDSLHCKKLAIDINLFSPEGKFITASDPYKNLGLMWEGLHTLNRWGGRFKRSDGNHFEMQDINV
jgi:hypothetical protein